VSYTVITDKAVLTSLARSIFGLSRKMYLFTRKGIGRAVYAVLKIMNPDNVRRYVDPMDYYIAETEKGRDYILHGAPALILIHGPKKGPFICENCNIAAANIMSLAHAAGLGTCYIGFVTLALKLYPPLQKTARIPKGHKAHAALIIGYPAYRHAFTSSRKTPSIQWIQSYD
jgi:nitroreductase